MITRLTHKILLAIVCCFALVCVVPLTASAQGGIIKKGAQGVKKGVETGVDKTKEGAETVGRETKEVFTGDKDNDNDTQRMKGSETSTTTQEPSQTETTKKSTTTSKSTKAGSTETETAHKRLPATAGELPLLGLIGALALLASGTPKLIRLRR